MAKPVASGPAVVEPVDYAIDPLRLHRHRPARYPFLLQSTASGTPQGRYDLLFAFPGERLRLGPGDELTGPGDEKSFLGALDQWWAATPCLQRPDDLPFAGGWFLLLGYELAEAVEPTLQLPRSPDLPRALAVRVPVALIRDHARQSAWLVGEPGCEPLLARCRDDLRAAPPLPERTESPLATALEEAPAAQYLAAVQQAKRHIAAGDIFQANLSRSWRAEVAESLRPADLYARLRVSNPGPFAGLAVSEEMAIVSSSPERLVAVRNGRVSTRPIAGTRARRKQDGDEPTRAELLGDPKDRAEHVMLIDLERNDLGRICEAGSVEVDEFMVVESYSHVHHIVSNVVGTLRDKVTPGQVIRATFPGGTITGCPKVRCMQIIAELEGGPRGFYTGAMGYLGHDGSLDLNILIRSIVLSGRVLGLAAGSGIVADSDPQAELAETRAKAKGMLLAIDKPAAGR